MSKVTVIADSNIENVVEIIENPTVYSLTTTASATPITVNQTKGQTLIINEPSGGSTNYYVAGNVDLSGVYAQANLARDTANTKISKTGDIMSGWLYFDSVLGNTALGVVQLDNGIDVYADETAYYAQLNWANTNYVYVDGAGSYLQTANGTGINAYGNANLVEIYSNYNVWKFNGDTGEIVWPDNTAQLSAFLGYAIDNVARDLANTKLSSSGGTITGNLSITGSLSVSGNAYTIDTQNLTVSDPLIYLAGNNYVSDIVDIGFVANYVNATGQNVHTGIFRDATIKEYYVFEGYDREPIPNHIDTAGNNFTISILNATLRSSNVILNGKNVSTWISSSYIQANTSRDSANAAYAQANSAANGVQQISVTSNRVLGLGDQGKYLYYNQSSSLNLNIPDSGTVNFANGTTILLISKTSSSANVTITPNSGVSLYLSGNNISSSRNLSSYGMATLIQVEANTWFINGTGLT